MYNIIVYDATADEIEIFVEDYFKIPNNIFDKVKDVKIRPSGDVIISLEDFDTFEDLMFGLRSEGFDAEEN